MAIKKITYDNKVGVIPKNIHVNEVWDDDMNEIKDAINTNADQVIQNASDIQNIISGSVVPDATATVKGKLKLTGDLGGTADAPTTPTALHKTGVEDIRGRKRFFSDYIESGGIDIYGSVLNGGTMLNISPGSGTNSLGISVSASSGARGILVDLSSGGGDAIFVKARSGSNAFVADGGSGFSGNLFLGTNSGFTTSSIDKLGNAIFSGNVIGATPTLDNHLVTKAYADGLLVGLWNDRGNYNPNTNSNAYPSTGGSGTSGTIIKGNAWMISGLGTGVTAAIGSKTVNDGDVVRALVNNPGNTDANWAVAENNIGFTPANDANVVHIAGNETITGSKVFTGASTRFDIPLLLKKSGLSEYNQVSSYSGKLQFTENSGTQFNFSMGSDYFDFGIFSLGKVAKITNTLLSANRTYDLPNASGTIALTSDIPSSSSYIQNQNSSAQSANMWINGSISATSYTGDASLTGIPTAPTATAGTNTTQVATTAFVTRAVFDGLATKANDSDVIKTTGNQTKTGSLQVSISDIANGLTANQTTTGTGLNFVGSSNGVQTFTVNKLGVGYFADNISIGTNTPLNGGVGAKWLTANGTINYGGGLISSVNGAAKAYYYSDNGYAMVQGASGEGVKLSVNGANTALTALSNGNIGVGTTSPLNTFHSNGGTINDGLDKTYSARFSNNSATKAVVIGYDNINNVGHIGSIENGVSWRNLVLNYNGGNVGIGTNNPTVKLDVFQNDNTSSFIVKNSTNSFYVGNDSNGAFLGGYKVDNSNFIPLQLQKFGGNVLIGSTTDNGAKLQVSGDITSSGSIKTVGVAPYFEFRDTSNTQIGFIQNNGANMLIKSNVGTVIIDNSVNVNGTISTTGIVTGYTNALADSVYNSTPNRSNNSSFGETENAGSGTGFYVLETFRYNASDGMQRITYIGGSATGKIYTRVKSGNVWASWVEK